jgi:hypothetical protein
LRGSAGNRPTTLKRNSRLGRDCNNENQEQEHLEERSYLGCIRILILIMTKSRVVREYETKRINMAVNGVMMRRSKWMYESGAYVDDVDEG